MLRAAIMGSGERRCRATQAQVHVRTVPGRRRTYPRRRAALWKCAACSATCGRRLADSTRRKCRLNRQNSASRRDGTPDSTVGEVGQLGADRPARRRPRATRRRPGRRSRRPGGAAPRRRRPVRRRRAAGERGLDLVEALAAVDEVVVERAERVVEHRTVAGQIVATSPEAARARIRSMRVEVRRRADRRGRRPRWCRGRAPCRRRAAARSAGSSERDRVGGVAGRGHAPAARSPSTSMTSSSASGSPLKQYAGSRARTAQPLRVGEVLTPTSEWSKWWWVSSTSATSPVCSSSSVDVAVLDRPGVDHDRPGRHRARAAPRCWCRRAS